VRPGEDPRYYGEIWWLIGDYHFNEVSQAGGPFNLNRADAAYGNSLKYKKPPVFGVAMYKRAWTYFKQQRYRDSVGEFIELLRYADAEEKRTGDPGADFRAEAYTYIAGSLTYLDFDGPAVDDPYIPRNDVLDTETDPRKAEQKMRIAIDRVQDPCARPPEREVDGRGLPRARPGVPRAQPVPEHHRAVGDHPGEVAERLRRAGRPEPDRRDLRHAHASVA
jgi:hypothetical protein